MKNWLFVASFLVAIFVYSCAQQRPITGGAKDTTPPQIVTSSPQNYSTNFKGDKIVFEFDEYIQVKSLNSEMIVSPPLSNSVDYIIKGKRLFMQINNALLPNTTYTFNFGQAIVDLNESNPLDSNVFIFSTGTYLDSGTVSGKLIDAYTQKPLKKATILLYPAHQDSAVYNGTPKYITKTADDGSFMLNYLYQQEFQIFGLTVPGAEFSYIPQTPVAFYPQTVTPNDSGIHLFAFSEIDTTQYVTRENAKDYYHFTVGFHADLKNPTFQLFPAHDSIQYYIQEIKSDSFGFWIANDISFDTVTLHVQDGDFMDTVIFDLPEREKYLKKLKRRDQEFPALKVSNKCAQGVHHYFDTLVLGFNRPIKSMNSQKIYFVQNTDTIRLDSFIAQNDLHIHLPQTTNGTTSKLLRAPVTYDWAPKNKYAFIFYPGAFTDILNHTNDTLIQAFKTLAYEDYGSFRFTVKVADYAGPLILELLDQKGNYIKAHYIHSGDVIFNQLAKPGNYKLRLILDENNNKKWDSGDLTKQQLPETTVYYDGEISIRPNWDMEETWNVQLTH